MAPKPNASRARGNAGETPAPPSRNAEGLLPDEARFLDAYQGDARAAEKAAGLTTGSGRNYLRRKSVREALGRRERAMETAAPTVAGASKLDLVRFWVSVYRGEEGESTTKGAKSTKKTKKTKKKKAPLWARLACSEDLARAMGYWSDQAADALDALKFIRKRRKGEAPPVQHEKAVDTSVIPGAEKEDLLRFWGGIYRGTKQPMWARIRAARNVARTLRLGVDPKKVRPERLILELQRFLDEEGVT